MTGLDPRAIQSEYADLGIEASGADVPADELRIHVPADAVRKLFERLQRSGWPVASGSGEMGSGEIGSGQETAEEPQASSSRGDHAGRAGAGPADSRRVGLELFDLTAIDRGPGHPDRIELVYRLRAGSDGVGLRIGTALALAAPDARPEVASIAPLFPAARWLEREVAELFGVTFVGHPDPRPLLLETGFPGWPLRKDFGHAAGLAREERPPASGAPRADAT